MRTIDRSRPRALSRRALLVFTGAVAITAASGRPAATSTPLAERLAFDRTREAYVFRGELIVPFVVLGTAYDPSPAIRDIVWCNNAPHTDWLERRHDLYVVHLIDGSHPILRRRRYGGPASSFDFTDAELRKVEIATPVRSIEYWQGSRADV